MEQGERNIGFSQKLVLLAILTMPFISVPIFPSSYRPLSVLFLVLPSFLILIYFFREKNISLLKEDLSLILFFLISVCISVGLGGLNNGDWSDVAFENSLLAIGVLSFFCFRNAVISYEPSKIIFFIHKTALILLALGFFEILVLYGPFPSSLRDVIMYAMNGEISPRVQLTTSEAAWAGRIFIPTALVLALAWWVRRTFFDALFAGLAVILIILTFSVETYLTLAATGVVFSILFPERVRWKPVLIGSAVTIGLVGIGVPSLLAASQAPDAPYYLTRLQKVANLPATDLVSLAQLDESVFIRVNYPLISFQIFMDHPLFGVGNGQYDDYFPRYLSALGKAPWQNDQIVADVVNGTGDPRNLLGRILAENGIIGATPFIVFIFLIWLGLKRADFSPAVQIGQLWLAFSIASTLQFGSLVYLHNWFFWAFGSAVVLCAQRQRSSLTEVAGGRC